MAKKKKTQETGSLNLETILFNCREYLRSNASLTTSVTYCLRWSSCASSVRSLKTNSRSFVNNVLIID